MAGNALPTHLNAEETEVVGALAGLVERTAVEDLSDPPVVVVEVVDLNVVRRGG